MCPACTVDAVEHAQRLLRLAAGEDTGTQAAAQLAHQRRGGDALAGDVADRQRELAAVELDGVVPVAADVAGGRARSGRPDGRPRPRGGAPAAARAGASRRSRARGRAAAAIWRRWRTSSRCVPTSSSLSSSTFSTRRSCSSISGSPMTRSSSASPAIQSRRSVAGRPASLRNAKVPERQLSSAADRRRASAPCCEGSIRSRSATPTRPPSRSRAGLARAITPSASSAAARTAIERHVHSSIETATT